MPMHMEEVAPKVMGKAKLAKGVIEGLSGIFTTLMEEHGQVAALLMQAKHCEPSERSPLWEKIRAELLAHERAELLVLYPVYRTHPEIAHLALMHERDAAQVVTMIEQVDDTECTDPLWLPRVSELAKVVQHHALEEEREFFREGNRVFGTQNKALDEEYKHAKAHALDALR